MPWPSITACTRLFVSGNSSFDWITDGHDAFVAFDQDDSASVAVFWGEGGEFCAGWDLKAAAALRGDNPMQAYAYPDDPAAHCLLAIAERAK